MESDRKSRQLRGKIILRREYTNFKVRLKFYPYIFTQIIIYAR